LALQHHQQVLAHLLLQVLVQRHLQVQPVLEHRFLQLLVVLEHRHLHLQVVLELKLLQVDLEANLLLVVSEQPLPLEDLILEELHPPLAFLLEVVSLLKAQVVLVLEAVQAHQRTHPLVVLPRLRKLPASLPCLALELERPRGVPLLGLDAPDDNLLLINALPFPFCLF
jgi:hypothetical protein